MQRILASILVVLAHLTLATLAQQSAARVRPEKAAYEVGPAAETTIVVLLEDAADVYGIVVRAAYDPALVEVVDADPARAGVQVQPGQFPQPDFVARQDVDPAAGSIRYVITQVNPTPPATGSGVLFTVRLRGRGVAGATEFRIDEVEMSTRSGELLPVEWEAATLNLSGQVPGPAQQPTGIVITPPGATPGGDPAALPTLTPEPSPPPATAAVATLAVTLPATVTANPPAATAVPLAPAATSLAPATIIASPPSVESLTGDANMEDATPLENSGSSPAAIVDGMAVEPVAEVVAEATATPPAVAVIGQSQVATAPRPALADETQGAPVTLWPVLAAIGVVMVGVVVWLARRSRI